MSIEQLIKSGAIAPGSTHWEVNSPNQALTMLRNIFKGHCTVDNATVCAIIERGYQTGMAPAAPMPGSIPYPAALPPIRPCMDAGEALDLLYREVNVSGRHYLPCDWLRVLAQGRMGQADALTPAQQRAHQLLEAAIAYEAKLSSCQTRGEPTDELKALRELITPLRPPTLEEALEALRKIAAAGPIEGIKGITDVAQAIVARAK